jgi:hypothetical protein
MSVCLILRAKTSSGEDAIKLDEGVVVLESKSIRAYCAAVMEGVAAL